MKCYICTNIANKTRVIHLHQYIKKTISLCDIHYDNFELTSDQRKELLDQFMASQTTFE